MEPEQIEAAFKNFDTDGSGTLSADEVLAILTRSSGGAALTIADAKEVISDFDANGDGELQLQEFVNAWAVIGDGGAIETYGPLIKGHEDRLAALFKKLDVDGGGQLECNELKDVVVFYSGEEFDEEEFFGWYDSHGENGGKDVRCGALILGPLGYGPTRPPLLHARTHPEVRRS